MVLLENYSQQVHYIDVDSLMDCHNTHLLLLGLDDVREVDNPHNAAVDTPLHNDTSEQMSSVDDDYDTFEQTEALVDYEDN